MFNSVQPHRWQPTRLLCPWDSPGKNTGVGCHFLLQSLYFGGSNYMYIRLHGVAPYVINILLLFSVFFLPVFHFQFSSVQLSFSRVRLFATPWTTAYQASPSITNPQSLFKLMSIGSVMPSNHLILCHPLFLLPSIFPSIRIFSNESVLHIRWPKNWTFSFNISPSNEY